MWSLTPPLPKALNKLGERYGAYGKRVTLQELMPKTHRVLSRAQGLLVEEMGWEVVVFARGLNSIYVAPYIGHSQLLSFGRKTGIFHLYMFFGSFKFFHVFKNEVTEKWVGPLLSRAAL